MSDIAIRVENLSKVYRIGQKEPRHETILSAATSFLKSPLANYRNLRNLSRFDSTDGEDVIWALRDVSFEVKHGDAVGIIGRNGAGKSTLLKLLSRITEPSGGRATVFGRVGSLLEVGTGFHPDLTGRENIYLNGTILGMRKYEVDEKFDEIVEFSGVDKFIDTPVKRYSSGMRVRLAFSVAAHLEPEILIIDEVLAVGDAAFQRKCLGKMGEVSGQGRTVLFVSHNMGALTSLCPKSIWLEAGKMVDSGDSQQIVAKYIERTGEFMPTDGFNNVKTFDRPLSLANRHAEFTWVRTLRKNGRQASEFLEAEPMIIQLGFSVSKPVSEIQLGCGVRMIDSQIDLFTVASPEFDGGFKLGDYIVNLEMDPNYLREGAYGLVLKMFTDGVRQDTIADVLRVSVVACRHSKESASFSQKWVSGPLRINYRWNAPEHQDSSSH